MTTVIDDFDDNNNERIGKKHTSQLGRIKKCVEQAYKYFEDNCKEWHRTRKQIFWKMLTSDEVALLQSQGKPQLEFNLIEALVSRLRGEFAKQEPSIEVRSDYGVPIDPRTIDTVEGIFRHIMNSSKKDGTEMEIITKILTGGFAVGEVGTKYVNENSFHQVPYFSDIDDPTLCGFDPLAITPHKGDGRFCFKFYPKVLSDFKNDFPNINVKELDFTRSVGGFNWCYTNNREKVLLICDFFEKKKKKAKILRLANEMTVTADAYKKFLEMWEDIAPPPAIVEERMATQEIIVRYRFIQNQLLETPVETDFEMLPLIFFDGNSVKFKNEDGVTKQYTRSFAHHAFGTQRLKNFIGIQLANEAENMVQHKIMIASQAIPRGEAADALSNIQNPNTLIWDAFDADGKQLPPPSPVIRTPIDQSLPMMFSMLDQTMQGVTGSYDGSIGINNNDLSGEARAIGIMQSNAAAMPFMINFMQGINRVANCIVSLIPKYMTTPRTIPILDKNGKKSYKVVNEPGEVQLNYDVNALQVVVEPGVNFAIQKSRSLQAMHMGMQANPVFAQFIAEKCLPEYVSNFDIRGVDSMKEKAEAYVKEMEEMKKQQAQAAAQQEQNNPFVLQAKVEEEKVEQKREEAQLKTLTNMKDLKIKEQKVENERIKIAADIGLKQEEQIAKSVMHQSELLGKGIDKVIKMVDVEYKHSKPRKDIRNNQPEQL